MNLFFYFLTLLFLLILSGIALFFYGLWYFGKDLPDYKDLSKYNPNVVTRIHAGNGALLAEYATQKRVFVPINVIPKKVIDAFIDALHELGTPHPPHIHCNNLGHSGNFDTTLETMKTAGDRRLHIAHIQFNSYGGELGKSPKSASKEITDYVNDHENITCDVGQVMFGKAMFMTADAPLTYLLRGYKPQKWVNADTECESGCGILPFDYQGMIYTHAIQWAIGLEIFLLSKDPWRIVLSTDHPNGGSFMNYPMVIKLLISCLSFN